MEEDGLSYPGEVELHRETRVGELQRTGSEKDDRGQLIAMAESDGASQTPE